MSVKHSGMSLRSIKQRIAALGVNVARETAARVAPMLSALAHADYDAARTVYGDARPLGANGPVTLARTGKMESSMAFVAIGAMIRAALSVRYAKYHVGRFRVLPVGDRVALPVKWAKAIDAVFQDVARSS